MPTIIDRYMLRQFLQVLVICFLSLAGLYIVIDAFSHLDHFVDYADKHGSLLLDDGPVLRLSLAGVFRLDERHPRAGRRDVHRHLDPAAPGNDGAHGGRHPAAPRAAAGADRGDLRQPAGRRQPRARDSRRRASNWPPTPRTSAASRKPRCSRASTARPTSCSAARRSSSPNKKIVPAELRAAASGSINTAGSSPPPKPATCRHATDSTERLPAHRRHGAQGAAHRAVARNSTANRS